MRRGVSHVVCLVSHGGALLSCAVAGREKWNVVRPPHAGEGRNAWPNFQKGSIFCGRSLPYQSILGCKKENTYRTELGTYIFTHLKLFKNSFSCF